MSGLGPCLQDETDLRPKLKLVFTKTRLKSVYETDNREMIQVLFLKVQSNKLVGKINNGSNPQRLWFDTYYMIQSKRLKLAAIVLQK